MWLITVVLANFFAALWGGVAYGLTRGLGAWAYVIGGAVGLCLETAFVAHMAWPIQDRLMAKREQERQTAERKAEVEKQEVLDFLKTHEDFKSRQRAGRASPQ